MPRTPELISITALMCREFLNCGNPCHLTFSSGNTNLHSFKSRINKFSLVFLQTPTLQQYLGPYLRDCLLHKKTVIVTKIHIHILSSYNTSLISNPLEKFCTSRSRLNHNCIEQIINYRCSDGIAICNNKCFLLICSLYWILFHISN